MYAVRSAFVATAELLVIRFLFSCTFSPLHFFRLFLLPSLLNFLKDPKVSLQQFGFLWLDARSK